MQAGERLLSRLNNLSAKGTIIRYTSKPERVSLFYNRLINFYISDMLGEKEKKRKVNAHKNDANKHFDWLIFWNWNCDWTRARQALMSNEFSQCPIDHNKKAVLLVYILPTALFEN